MTGFGASGPYKALYEHFGITAARRSPTRPPNARRRDPVWRAERRMRRADSVARGERT